MFKYLKQHEKFILDKINEGCDLYWLSEYHKTQIKFMQHERLIHLIVTMTIGLFLLLTIFFITAYNILILLPLAGLFLILAIPYIFHYYHLENGIQRLYKLYDEIERKKAAGK